MSHSAKNRHAAVRSVHKMYRKSEAGLNGKCVYCGKYADTLDHIPPVSIAVNLRREYLAELDPVLVPACRHCNSIIGASEQIKLVDRRDLVAGHLQTKKSRMLNFGKKLLSQNLTVLHDWRDAACVEIYERWQFATLSQNEVEEPEVEEEPYDRADLVKGIDTAELTIWQSLSSWGISDEFVDAVTSSDPHILKRQAESYSEKDQQIFKIFELAYPMRGPFSWLNNWINYAELLCKHFPTEIDHEITMLKFERVRSAQEAFHTVVEVLRSSSILSENLEPTFADDPIGSAGGVDKANNVQRNLFQKIRSLRKLVKQSNLTKTNSISINIPAEIWPFTKTQQYYENIFFKNQSSFEDIAFEYRYARREIKHISQFSNFIDELPYDFQRGLFSEISAIEFYVMLILHCWVIDGVSRPFLFKIALGDNTH